MRRGNWIFAVTGLMALYQSGNAADPVADQSAGRASIGTAKISSKNPVKTADASANSKPKNYYKELFGEDESTTAVAPKRYVPASAPSNTESDDWTDAPRTTLTKAASKKADIDDFGVAVDSGEALLVKAAPKKAAIDADFAEPDSTELPTVSEKKSQAVTNPPKVNPKVAQAYYDRPVGKKDRVQQVRNDGRPKSAPPLSGADEPAPKETAPKEPASKPKRPVVAVKVRDTNSFEEKNSPDDFSTTSKSKVAAVAEPSGTGLQTTHITLEWVKRGEFNVGQQCQAELIVKNAGISDVSQFSIDSYFPTNVRLISAEPKPVATDHLTWTFDRLAAGNEQRIIVTMIPSKRGEIGATAQVRFAGACSAAFAVQEPMLKVAIKAPTREVMLGDPASQMITVTNPGTGTANDVKIEAKLSEGLEHPTREDHLVIDVGSVGPGEIRTYRLGLTAAKGGTQSINVVATSSSDVTSSDSIQFEIVAPSLKVAVEGPSLRYKGRNAKYTLTVTNDGNLVNNNIRVSQLISDGFKFVSADRGGKFDSSSNSIHWFVGRLDAGESTQFVCELNSLQIGEFTHKVQVVSDSGVQSDARIETRIDGIASLTMELVDLDDPVEVGSETSYEIRVKNDGSKAATGVQVGCELPAGMQFLSARAPVDHVVEGRQLAFSPIERIAPGDHVTIQVRMKVTKDGNHRMRARLTGGGLQEPMGLEEVTRAYSDGSN